MRGTRRISIKDAHMVEMYHPKVRFWIRRRTFDKVSIEKRVGFDADMIRANPLIHSSRLWVLINDRKSFTETFISTENSCDSVIGRSIQAGSVQEISYI